MTFSQARELSIKGVVFAIQNDGSSGGNIRIVDVKRSGETTEDIIDNKEIKKLAKR